MPITCKVCTDPNVEGDIVCLSIFDNFLKDLQEHPAEAHKLLKKLHITQFELKQHIKDTVCKINIHQTPEITRNAMQAMNIPIEQLIKKYNLQLKIV